MDFTDPNEDQAQVTLEQLPLAALKRKLSRWFEQEYGITSIDLDVPQEASGTGSVTITNGVNAVTVATAHGLGDTPAIVLGTANIDAFGRDDYLVSTYSRDATHLVFIVRAVESAAFPVANPTTVTFDWVAKL